MVSFKIFITKIIEPEKLKFLNTHFWYSTKIMAPGYWVGQNGMKCRLFEKSKYGSMLLWWAMWPTGLLFKKYYSFNRQILLILFHKIDVIVFIFRSNILDLPDDVIIHILSFLSVQDILINVSRVNNFLYSVVKNYPRLWETMHFSDVFTLDENILKIILNNSKHIQTLDLGCQEITLDEDYFNRLL